LACRNAGVSRRHHCPAATRGLACTRGGEAEAVLAGRARH
jgi:hypothetical protein